MTRPYRTESWFQHAYPDNLSALRDLQHRARLSIPDNVLARQHGRPAGLGHIGLETRPHKQTSHELLAQRQRMPPDCALIHPDGC